VKWDDEQSARCQMRLYIERQRRQDWNVCDAQSRAGFDHTLVRLRPVSAGDDSDEGPN
jgi:hypothetical protein